MPPSILKRKLAAGLLLVIGLTTQAAEPMKPALRQELLAMSARDQEVRRLAEKGDFSDWGKVDAANRARLKQIVAETGWPTVAMAGEDGAHAAWLLAQHADDDKAFQLEVLALMEPLVQSRQASGSDYAYLHDRTHYPQRFGTQGACISREEWQPFEIEDIAHVDERRQAVHLPALAEYVKLFKDICANPNMRLFSGSDAKRTVPVPAD